MALIGNSNAEKIWNFLLERIHNEFGVAALMGNLSAESGLRPNNMENYYEAKLDFTDDSYTAAVDDGSYKNFIKDAVGYGIAQWTYHTRKQNLYVYLKNVKKVSIGDLEGQLEFLYKELSSDFKAVLNTLCNATNIYDASTFVLIKFENPKNKSDSVKNTRAAKGKEFYDQFAGKKNNPAPKPPATPKKTPKEIANEIIQGKWGSGDERKKRVTEAGYNYAEVQNMVNEILGSSVRVEPEVSYYPKYVGNTNSVVEALRSVGCKDYSITFRKKIANKNNIPNYSGTAKQNTQMLKLLKAGKLIEP